MLQTSPIPQRTLTTHDVVLRDGLAKGDPGAPDQAALQAWCAERLPEYSVPRRIRFLDAIPIKQTLKSDV